MDVLMNPVFSALKALYTCGSIIIKQTKSVIVSKCGRCYRFRAKSGVIYMSCKCSTIDLYPQPLSSYLRYEEAIAWKQNQIQSLSSWVYIRKTIMKASPEMSMQYGMSSKKNDVEYIYHHLSVQNQLTLRRLRRQPLLHSMTIDRHMIACVLTWLCQFATS